MKVILAGKAGFCMGVKRAMDIVASLAHDPDEAIYTDGPIIHNPQVIDILKKRNIKPLEKNTDLTDKTVIIRTHGITPARRKELNAQGSKLIDVTCPRVMRIQKTIERQVKKGDYIIIYGDKDHSEVKALLGFTDGKGIALDDIKELQKLPKHQKVTVVSQSTKNKIHYDDFIEKLKIRHKKITVFDTLCDTTNRRQTEAFSLAQSVDAVVVVGGKTSANTKTLAKRIAESGKPVFHIETEKEIQNHELRKFSSVALTAGASTPNWMINRVLEKLQSIRSEKESRLSFFTKIIARAFIYSNLFVSLAALFLSFSSAALIGVDSGIKQYLIGPLYVYAMLILNIFVDTKSLEINQPSRINFLQRNKVVLISTAIFAMFMTIYLASSLQIETLYAISAAVLLGLIYSVPILPGRWSKIFHLHRFKDIPGSKNFLVAIAWASTTVLVHPISMHGLKIYDMSAITAFLWVFFIVFNRSVVEDIRYLQGDAIIGHGTLPVLIGEKRVYRALLSIDFFVLVLLIVGASLSIISKLGFLFALPLLYSLIYRRLNRKTPMKNNLLFETILNIEFILYGLISLIWVLLFPI